MSSAADYWEESLSIAFDECGIYEIWSGLSAKQKADLAKAIEGSHENYGLAHYTPPASDRLAQIDGEWKAKCERLEKDFESYRRNAEKAVGRALNQPGDARISIGKYGEVTRHDGRTTVIQ